LVFKDPNQNFCLKNILFEGNETYIFLVLKEKLKRNLTLLKMGIYIAAKTFLLDFL